MDERDLSETKCFRKGPEHFCELLKNQRSLKDYYAGFFF